MLDYCKKIHTNELNMQLSHKRFRCLLLSYPFYLLINCDILQKIDYSYHSSTNIILEYP